MLFLMYTKKYFGEKLWILEFSQIWRKFLFHEFYFVSLTISILSEPLNKKHSSFPQMPIIKSICIGLYVTGTTRQDQSNLEWSGVRNPKLQRPKWWTPSLATSKTTLPCSLGRLGTGCCPSMCVPQKMYQVSPLSTGKLDMYMFEH